MKANEYMEMMTTFNTALAMTEGTEDYKDALADWRDFFRIGARHNFSATIENQDPSDIVRDALDRGDTQYAHRVLGDMSEMITILNQECYDYREHWQREYDELNHELWASIKTA